MPIYYVDPALGSNSNDGLSWATAWETTLPLATLYATASSVTDVEVRFAKSSPIATDVALATSTSIAVTGNNTKRKVIGTETNSATNTVATRGGALQTGFVAASTISTERPAGVGHSRFMGGSATAQGRAVKWTLSTAQDYSMYHSIEFVAAAFTSNDRDMTTFPVHGTLEMCSDSAGTNVVWSRSFKFGPGKDKANFIRLGAGDLPSGILSIWLSVSHTPDEAGSIVIYSYSSMYAVRPPTSPDYVGFMRVHHCKTRDGASLQPFRYETATEQYGTSETVGYNNARTSRGLQPRLYDTYAVPPLPHDTTPLFPVATTVGTPSAPVRFTGGWDKDTGLADGLSCIDAGSLLMAKLTPGHWHARFSNLILGFVRGSANQTLGSNTFPPRCICSASVVVSETASVYADNVHIPPSSPANLSVAHLSGEVIAHNESLFRVSLTGTNTLDGEVVRCSNGYGPIVQSNAPSPSFRIRDSYICYTTPLLNHPTEPLEDCRIGPMIVGVTLGVAQRLKSVERCKIISSTSASAASPLGFGVPHKDCEVWGGMSFGNNSVPTVLLEDSVFYPYLTAQATSFGRGVNIKNVRFDLGSTPTTSVYNYSGAMGGYDIYTEHVSIEDSTIPVIYSRLTSTAKNYNLVNCTLSFRTGMAASVADTPSTLRVRNLTLEGAWTALLVGSPAVADVDGVIFTETTTKLHTPYSYPSRGNSWGRVSCRFSNLFHPSGFSGVLGSPVTSATLLALGGALYSMRDEEPRWVAAHMTVEKDTAVKLTGSFSWKFTARMHIGSKFVGSIMLGFYEVAQGQTITVSCKMRRGHRLTHGCLFIQPLDTKEFTYNSSQVHNLEREVVADQDYTNPIGQWDTVVLQYTAERSGMLELHFGMRASNGNSVWLDDIKVS